MSQSPRSAASGSAQYGSLSRQSSRTSQSSPQSPVIGSFEQHIHDDGQQEGPRSSRSSSLKSAVNINDLEDLENAETGNLRTELEQLKAQIDLLRQQIAPSSAELPSVAVTVAVPLVAQLEEAVAPVPPRSKVQPPPLTPSELGSSSQPALLTDLKKSAQFFHNIEQLKAKIPKQFHSPLSYAAVETILKSQQERKKLSEYTSDLKSLRQFVEEYNKLVLPDVRMKETFDSLLEEETWTCICAGQPDKEVKAFKIRVVNEEKKIKDYFILDNSLLGIKWSGGRALKEGTQKLYSTQLEKVIDENNNKYVLQIPSSVSQWLRDQPFGSAKHWFLCLL